MLLFALPPKGLFLQSQELTGKQIFYCKGYFAGHILFQQVQDSAFLFLKGPPDFAGLY
jgi:hypothetical protein